MKVAVDPQVCEANAVCVTLDPEVFELDDDDVLHILVTEVTPEHEDRVRKAVVACPKQALRLLDVEEPNA